MCLQRKKGENETIENNIFFGTVKLGDKERFDKEQIGVKELLALRNNFRVTKKFLITKSDCTL